MCLCGCCESPQVWDHNGMHHRAVCADWPLRARLSARATQAGRGREWVWLLRGGWGLTHGRRASQLPAVVGQEPATPGAMLFWTALSMALSLRLALARSGVERGKCGETWIPVPHSPSAAAHAGHELSRCSRRTSRKAGGAGGAHASTSATCSGRSKAFLVTQLC